jgi:hypothetical protein
MVAQYTDYLKAEMGRLLLEKNGIRAIITGDNMANTYAGVPAVMDLELLALKSEAPKAREILESQPEPEMESEPDSEQE